MEGVHFKLVKDIPRTFQNSYFICGSLFGILRIVRLQKIIGNQKDGWGFHTLLEMKYANKIIQTRRIQSNSPDQSSVLYAGTLLVYTSSKPIKTQIKHQNSMTRSQVFSTHQMISFLGIWIKLRLITEKFQGRQNQKRK